MITTTAGHTFQWTLAKQNPTKPVNNENARKRYGFVVWQINQVMKARAYDTIEEKETFVQSLIDKIHEIRIVSIMTPKQNARYLFLEAALQFYLDNINDPKVTGL